MNRSDNSYGLILASSPKFKEVFGKSNVSRAVDLPFLIESRKFNYQSWYAKHTDIHGQRTEPTLQYVTFIESWAKRTHIVPPQWGKHQKVYTKGNKKSGCKSKITQLKN